MNEQQAGLIERRASHLEALSGAFFDRQKLKPAKKSGEGEAADAEQKKKNPLVKGGKESFSPAATWMKPMVRGLNRFSRGSRNFDVIKGVGKFSRSRMYHKRGVWAVKAKNGGRLPTHSKRAAIKAKVQKRGPKFYPADDVSKPLHRNAIVNPPKIRPNLTPGTVVILLAGRFRGKRVLVLKHLDSGLLLVSGPFKVNGVPLRRVNQSYVISTSTKVDIGHIDLEKFGDGYFKRAPAKKKRKGESAFFEPEHHEATPGATGQLSEGRKRDQSTVDAHLIPVIDRVPDLKAYLSSRFSLQSGVKPHLLVF